MNEMVDAVIQDWNNYPKESWDKVFLTLMAVMDEVIKCHSGNFYKLPHIHKDKLQRQNLLPMSLPLSDEAHMMLLGEH